MSNNPLVSIIIPSYNHGKYIKNAIESALAQTYPNIELIIIDDGSTDDSQDVLSNYVSHPKVTVILNKENKGQSYVVNRALEVAKGEFISILPSDDWYLPHKTQVQINKFFASSDRVGVVYARGARFFEDTGETQEMKLPVFTGQVAEKFIEWGPFVYPVTPMFRRVCFDVAPMDESFKAEGEAKYIRIALHYEFDYVDDLVAIMRDHKYNIGKNVEVMYEEVLRYWVKFFERSDIPPHIKKLRPVRMERLHRTKGMQFIGERRNFRMGRLCLWRAVGERPAILCNPRVLGALTICHLPAPFANFIIDRYRSLNVRTSV